MNAAALTCLHGVIRGCRQRLEAVDRPPPAIKQQVDDAKARLAKLGDARR